ncbi:MAG: alpha/beta fold hydrolase [Actinobacteria bacterium]|nr:alpha/beta fold hydrolase [Actinomycetota bacterium]
MPFIETADRTSLFVTDWGSGAPVVFTHAWGLRSDEFDYQIPALTAAGLRCVLYDRRGHGRSDRPATGYDIDTMADDLAAVSHRRCRGRPGDHGVRRHAVLAYVPPRLIPADGPVPLTPSQRAR